jgi:hypothetical protein
MYKPIAEACKVVLPAPGFSLYTLSCLTCWSKLPGRRLNDNEPFNR